MIILAPSVINPTQQLAPRISWGTLITQSEIAQKLRPADYAFFFKLSVTHDFCLTHLHLTVDHSCILAIPVNVVHLSQVILLPEMFVLMNVSMTMRSSPEDGMKDVIHVDWEDVKEATGSSCVDCVASVVSVSPGIGSIRQGPVGQQVQHLLVGVVLTAQEHKVLQGVGQPVIVHCLDSMGLYYLARRK